jgi:hypothetical protein
MVLGCILNLTASGETIFLDSFGNAGGGVIAGDSVTNSVPFIDVQGDGWETPSGATPLYLDGAGHIFDATTNGGSATAAMIPIGPHGCMTLSATLQLPTGEANWIALGFGNSNQSLAGPDCQSGPWARVNNDGTIIFYGGVNTNDLTVFPNAFTNRGGPIMTSLAYNAFNGSATLSVVNAGITNVLLAGMPATNSLGSFGMHYLAFQFSPTDVALSNRWAGPVTLDWIPRPPPMLTLPVNTNNMITYPVGGPNGTNDTETILDRLSLAEVAGGPPVQIQFTAGATYIITNGATNADIPLKLLQATNVWINGNGCKILIKNPRIGFLTLQACSNIIVQGFTVDYDPLPYTQGVVTRNLYNNPIDTNTTTYAIEFRPEDGYPRPTDSNYTDGEAVTNAERWGTIMNTNYPGRGADNRWTIYSYGDISTTTNPGVYEVEMRDHATVSTIQAGDYWCMVSRWNGSSVYSASSSYQITFLDLTNYTGAAANFEATLTPMVNEVGCHVELGPPPAGATRPRIKTSNADGGYFGYTRIGPWVQNCVFTGLSDDVANAYTDPFVITNAPAQPTNTFSLWLYKIADTGGTPTPATAAYLRVGDQLAFFNAQSGVIFDEATITNVNLPCVSVDHPISGIVNGTYQTNTLVFNNSLNTSAVYLDNQFSNSRIHGIYCRADNMLIAHNSVSGMGLSAISAFPALDLSSPNSFVPTNVVIMDNILSDCSYSYEAINNDIPCQEPAFALVELHQTRLNSDYVTNTFGISGIRILYNTFLNWRRAPLSLHNVSDYHVIGNYFGPPITNDDLIPLNSDYIADLWSCDYSTMNFSGNVNATGIPDEDAISEDDNFASVPGTFQPLTAPRLAINAGPANAVVSWSSPAPGFELQQANALVAGGTDWMEVTNAPYIMGVSNTLTLPLVPGGGQVFYRASQR